VVGPTDSVDLAAIVARENRSERSVRMILSFAYLTPNIEITAIAGKLPRSFELSGMTDLPMDWAQQRKTLGLTRSDA
jgi:hypothetical protein